MWIEAAEAGLTIWDHRSKVSESLKRFWRWLRRGNATVPIFGPGGAGKTTLGSILSGEIDPFRGPQKYGESLGVNSFRLKGDVPCTLIVPPGQRRRADYTWSKLLQLVSAGRTHGIINVVAYGYHSFEAKWSDHRLAKAGTRDQFLARYLKECRQKEIDVVQQLVPHLGVRSKKIWMLTLVTKQDLWWQERENVEDFYEKGSYQKAIQAIESKLGSANFQHECLSVSLAVSNFVDGEMEVVAPVAAGYDQNIQTANLRRLIDHLSQLVG